ncbi:MAG: respiratory nitrate reductase subunit gamma [Gammaproteobacteria bacterium]|nr:respiratory nitrate reductase subunit gamma [Gammaproteobacteria bacterium]
MTASSLLFAALFYAAAAVLVGGLAVRIAGYARTPAPLKIPSTPAPVSRGGVALRLLREVTLFESLFRSGLWLWGLAWLFHAGLLLVLLWHLRYFTDPVWSWVVVLGPLGTAGALAMLAGLAGLWLRRLRVPRVRAISLPSDHLMLALLAGIGLSGLALKYAVRTDVPAVKAFFRGLMTFSWQPLPADPLLWTHLALVAALMIVFPFSKLLHAPGVFFSPTRNQADDPREARHLAPWAARLDG